MKNPKQMKVKIKKLTKTALLPTKAHATDAGFDLYADSIQYDNNGNTVYGTGIAIEIPQGHVGLIFPRSSNAKKDLILSNSVGVIDSGYRGEIMAKFKTTQNVCNPFKLWWQAFLWRYREINIQWTAVHHREYRIGDRIAQIIIIPYPDVEFEESDNLSDSDRGSGGYGSSGS